MNAPDTSLSLQVRNIGGLLNNLSTNIRFTFQQRAEEALHTMGMNVQGSIFEWSNLADLFCNGICVGYVVFATRCLDYP